MNRASQALSIVLGVMVPAIALGGSGACAADPESAPESPCIAFAKPSAPALQTEPAAASSRASALVRVRGGAGRLYALDADGKLGRVDAGAASTLAVGGVGGIDFAVTKDESGVVNAFVARWVAAAPGGPTTFELARFASADGGVTFDGASKKVLVTAPGGRAAGEAASMAFAPDGLLYVALGSAERPPGSAVMLAGSLLRLDVSGDTVAVPPVWASGFLEPRGLDVDPVTGDVWLTDYSARDSATLVHRITRGGIVDLKPMLIIASPEKRPASSGGHVYRGKRAPALAGAYVYPAPNGALVAVDRFGPSGPPQETKLALGVDGPIGRAEDDELVIAPANGGGVSRVVDGAPPFPAPASLLATKCFDLASPSGVPVGAIAYDVTTPLWSDGAAKERFVVVPKGTKITARADGDLVFPVGTVAVKTFAVDGKRVETRLLVQHDVEDWVGYSYAWNDAGTDAELVRGNRIAPLAGGKSWYFPSSADCTACHTPAAGYTLGLEAKQLAGHGDALARLESQLVAPIDHATLVPLVPVDAPAPATAEARARSYLHSNCSTCHREGSATGTVVDLDLRFDTPLAKTGLCREPQAGSLGITDPRIVAPHDPARSVIVARMRALDERRMPKLATRVVDEAGVAAVEAWIREMAACP
ncbi:MAG: hypothetical protein JWP87_4595 [Labilithrix sp.]|nr:hypothetical protein [Labilithrix sp.]